MSMQSLLSGNMTWLTIQSCWFSHSPKKKLESQLLPRGSSSTTKNHTIKQTQLEPLALAAASGVAACARAFDGVVPQLTNQPWKKANVWIALTFQEAGKRRTVAGSARRACRGAGTGYGLQRGVGCCVVVAGAGEFCLCFVEVDRVQTTKTATAIKLAEKKMFRFITKLYCLLFAMSVGGRACGVFCY